jgi:hypothetical protein
MGRQDHRAVGIEWFVVAGIAAVVGVSAREPKHLRRVQMSETGKEWRWSRE